MTEFLKSSNKNRALLVIAATFCLTLIAKDANCGVIDKPYTRDGRRVSDDINFHLYTNKNPSKSFILYPGYHENFAASGFISTHTTIIFIHGFTGSYDTDSAQAIKNAYLKNGNYNVIVVCWKKLAAWPWYNLAVKNTAIVGPQIANLIKWLEFKKAITLDNLHLIGFSLGAHVAAFTGEELARNQSAKIGRITGLDPAGPAWDKLGVLTNGLDKADAKIVDVIHTNTRFLGIGLPIGYVDFYVNSGKNQPGCSFFSIGCSHRRCWEYFAESIAEPFGFPTYSCKSWGLEPNNCKRAPKVYMGVALSIEQPEGIYSVKTKDAKPYKIESTPFVKYELNMTESNKHTHIAGIHDYSVHGPAISNSLYSIDEIVELSESQKTTLLREGDDIYFPASK